MMVVGNWELVKETGKAVNKDRRKLFGRTKEEGGRRALWPLLLNEQLEQQAKYLMSGPFYIE